MLVVAWYTLVLLEKNLRSSITLLLNDGSEVLKLEDENIMPNCLVHLSVSCEKSLWHNV